MKNKKFTNEVRINHIKKWYKFFLNLTESWDGDLGVELAYLFGAMARGEKIDASTNSSVVDVLIENNIGPKESIWHYINLIDDEWESISLDQFKKSYKS